MRFKKTGRVLALAVTCAVTMALLAACGSSSKSSGSKATSASTPASTTPSTATSSPTAAKPTGAAIKVGMICSCSGAQASQIGPTGKVATAWADSVNAAGGIDGSKVSMTVMDDGGSPATALQDAKTLVQQDHIVAMVGEFSLADAAFASYMASSGVPVVGGISPETSFLTNPDFYPSGAQVLTQTIGTVALAKTVAKTTDLGVPYCAESPICAEVVPLAQAGGEVAGGLKVTGLKVSSTAPSYTATCLSLKSSGVDGLFPAVASPVALRVVDGCAQQGYKPKIIGETSTASNAWLKDPNVNGALLSGYNANPSDTSLPAVAQLQAALNKYDPGFVTSSDFNYDVIGPWAGGQLFKAAAEAAHVTASSTAADVKKGLYALKNETLGGLSGPLNFVPGKPTFVGCYFTVEVTGGKFESLNGNKPTCFTPAQEKALITIATKLG